MMTRAVGESISREDDETERMVDRLLYNTPGVRRQRAEREAVLIALEYRGVRLDLQLDHDFRREVADLPGTDLITKYVILCMRHDPDLYWLDDDVDLFVGIIAAIHVLARQALWMPTPTYDALLALIQGKWMGPYKRGLDACRVIHEHRQAA